MKGPRNNKKTPPTAGFAIPGVDVEQIEKLLDFMAAHGLEEFEYAHGDIHIRLKKAAKAADVAPRAFVAPEMGSVAPPAPLGSGAEAGSHEPGRATPQPTEELHVIKSPIVGTFYAAPSPDAAPFVKLGAMINVGQVVCIVEAMKLMNEIEADVSGEVVRALAENGQPVEYGQPLFAIRTAKKK
jgi:acetyl-CoA carboxylase biotin carboxyl carrier protein